MRSTHAATTSNRPNPQRIVILWKERNFSAAANLLATEAALSQHDGQTTNLLWVLYVCKMARPGISPRTIEEAEILEAATLRAVKEEIKKYRSNQPFEDWVGTLLSRADETSQTHKPGATASRTRHTDLHIMALSQTTSLVATRPTRISATERLNPADQRILAMWEELGSVEELATKLGEPERLTHKRLRRAFRSLLTVVSSPNNG